MLSSFCVNLIVISGENVWFFNEYSFFFLRPRTSLVLCILELPNFCFNFRYLFCNKGEMDWRKAVVTLHNLNILKNFNVGLSNMAVRLSYKEYSSLSVSTILCTTLYWFDKHAVYTLYFVDFFSFCYSCQFFYDIHLIPRIALLFCEIKSYRRG